MANDDPHKSMREAQADDALGAIVWRVPKERIAALGLSADMLAAASAIAGALTFLLFWRGDFWWGLLSAIAFLVISRGAAAMLIPLAWWWAWSRGLGPAGHPLAPVYGIMVLWAAAGGAAVDFGLRRLFERRFGGTRIDGWRNFDRAFAPTAAGPTLNLALLALGLVVGRPEAGLVVVAWWTITTIFVHGVRLAHATELAVRGTRIEPRQ
ncbi:MAG: hypothetical protein V4513_03345 [Pseudomonadota bacterium]